MTNDAYSCTPQPPYVRPARPSDATEIAQIQAANMKLLLERLLERPLSPESSASLDIAAFAAQWDDAIRSKADGTFVLVAREKSDTAGFGAAVVTPASDSDGTALLITAFEVSTCTADARDHAARLLSALADKARDSGAREIHIWLFSGDDAAIRLFSEAGFAPEGSRQSFEVDGTVLTQHAWWAQL